MDTSDADTRTPLISVSNVTIESRDTRRPYQKQLAIYLILASTLFERIAFYSLAANFAPSIHLPDDTPCSTHIMGTFIFSGVSYIFTLIFAVISDAILARARTITVGFLLYLIGYIMTSIFAEQRTPYCPPNPSNETNILDMKRILQEQSTTWANIGLIIIAIGAGAVKSNLAVFGAEQVQDPNIPSRYFDKYFVAVNIGIITATLVIPPISFQAGDNTHAAYIFAVSAIFFAALLFIIGHRCYIHGAPYDSVLINCIPVLTNAFQNWYQHRQNQGQRSRERIHTSASHTTIEESIRIEEQPIGFLDFAKTVNHGNFHDRIVDDVKSLRSAFIVFTLLIPYWLIYNQLYVTFPLQGKRMRRSDPTYIVFWMTLGDPVTIIIGTLILNIFVYRFLAARHRSLTILAKFVIGMFLASVTMFIAGGIEMIRQKECNEMDGNSTLSIYHQLFQTIFMGFSELFATVACFEFSYFAAPRSAQSLFMSLYYCTVGVSSFIGYAYMSIFQSDSSDLDFRCPKPSQMHPNFYNYFFVLGGIQLLFVIILIVCQKKFQIIQMQPQQTQTPHSFQYSPTPSVDNE